MRPGPSPLLGYNNNVRHKGKLYHIQTEDSGVNHPHIITHLFADGGRIIGSRKTEYSQHLGSPNLQEIVKKLMQEQHKAMFIALRDCVYDEEDAAAAGGASTAAGSSATPSVAPKAAAAASAAPSEPESPPAPLPELDFDALERAAEAHIAESAAAKSRKRPKQRASGRYSQTAPAQKKGSRASTPPAERSSIFDDKVVLSKSLDEVILSYLADDKVEDK